MSVELTTAEEDLLRFIAGTIDMNRDRLVQAQKGVETSLRIFRAAYEAVLQAHGLSPKDFRVSWDGKFLAIERVEEPVDAAL